MNPAMIVAGSASHHQERTNRHITELADTTRCMRDLFAGSIQVEPHLKLRCPPQFGSLEPTPEPVVQKQCPFVVGVDNHADPRHLEPAETLQGVKLQLLRYPHTGLTNKPPGQVFRPRREANHFTERIALALLMCAPGAKHSERADQTWNSTWVRDDRS